MASVILNTKGLEAGFNVRHMTIFNWRAGSATREALPCDVSETNRVTFKLAQVKAWAKKHDLAFDEAKAIKATDATLTVLPGPKPKAKPADKIDRKKMPKAAPAKKAATKAKVRPAVKAKFAKPARPIDSAAPAAKK